MATKMNWDWLGDLSKDKEAIRC
ncbi:MAG: hypothetical protein UT69_C0037G0001, partial [Candidatus Yanofskybacteria bacterium GW2011_GWE1_40_10]